MVLTVRLLREATGRWIADVPELPGVTVYGTTPEAARRKPLKREGWPQYRFAFHDKEELGPVMRAEIARHPGLRADDL